MTAVSVIEVAVRFVASQPGGAGRILTIHYRRPNGICAGCSTTPVRWPCAAARIATDAVQQPLQQMNLVAPEPQCPTVRP